MAHGKTILICDDDQGMRDTLSAILKRDYRVLTVSSGEAALVLLREADVDLILLDVRLPGISGFDVLRIVRENYGLVECIMRETRRASTRAASATSSVTIANPHRTTTVKLSPYRLIGLLVDRSIDLSVYRLIGLSGDRAISRSVDQSISRLVD